MFLGGVEPPFHMPKDGLLTSLLNAPLPVK
jgi:hypothetical protein